MKRAGIFNFLKIFLLVFILFTPFIQAEELSYKVISEGYLEPGDRTLSMVVKEKETLDNLLVNKSINEDAAVNFDTETVAVIVSDKGRYPDTLVIEDIVKNSQGIVNVNFSINSIDYVPEQNEKIKRPYKIIKISPAGKDLAGVSFRYTGAKSAVFVNNSVDNLIKYTNVMEDNRENLFLNYLPLDKGNSWTYDFESPRGKGSQTFSVITYTNGWSIFDSYFGMNNIALRLDRGGHIHVSSDSGNRPFYTPDVLVSYPQKSFTSDAGVFNDIMVVTSNDKSNFNFKDIYARDVGLVYHEHQTKDGLTKYSLSNAYVRGKQIP